MLFRRGPARSRRKETARGERLFGLRALRVPGRMMKTLSSMISSVAAVALALASGVVPAQTKPDPQSYPARPIRIIVPNTPASSMDNVSRMIGQRLTDAWGHQIVVDNRPGAGGILGHELAAKAPADGYTLLFS